MLRFLLLFSIYTPLFGQVILNNEEEIGKETLLVDSSNIEKIEFIGTFFDLVIDSISRDLILSDDKERWDQLSKYQLIRILSVSTKYSWPSDSLIQLVYNKNQGYSRDSLILWLEEGGVAGDERKRIKMIEANKYQIITEAFNYFGDIREIDLSLRWYAVVASEDRESYELINVKPKVILSQFQSESGQLEFDINHNRETGSHFLFGCPVAIDTGYISTYDDDISSFYPGKSSLLSRNNKVKEFSLSALGSVTGLGACGGLENYALVVKYFGGPNNDIELYQDIGPEIIDSLNSCVPELFWHGDLIGDDIPDALFLQKIDNGLRLILFLSDSAPSNKIWIKSAEWILLNEPRED
tara:strand:- start:3281 stop:4342 length:1062 start_codon:yes stop_codon:yes gene_type:complete